MLRFGVPLAFLALLILLGAGLTRDPREVPSPLVGKMLPTFDLERLRLSGQRLNDADVKGKIALVNVWATWCPPCREEHPLLVGIADRTGLPIYGINYKDDRTSAVQWLENLGDPYVASGYDEAGTVGLDLGVYGLPETFVVAADGRIAYKHIGPITEQVWQETLAPVIRSLQGG